MFKIKGFIFSLEALISLLIFVLILSTLPIIENNSLKDLIILQQANDLLKVWSMTNLNHSEMIVDAKAMFGNNVSVYKDEQILIKGFGNESISTSAIIFDDFLIKRTITIIVYIK